MFDREDEAPTALDSNDPDYVQVGQKHFSFFRFFREY
jgi:hypothetical protein